MKRTSDRVSWQPVIIALGVSLCCSLVFVLRPSLARYVDYRIFDKLVAGVPRPPAANRTLIVDIDEASIAKVGRWPWPRDLLARLVDKVRYAGPGVIALDIMFPEPDPNPANDKKLAAALRGANSVLGYDFVFDPAHNEPNSCQIPPKPLVSPQVLPASQIGVLLPEASAIICDVPALQTPDIKSGFLNALGDKDNMVRRVPLLMAYKGGVYPSFALAIAILSSNPSSVTIARTAGSQPLLQWDSWRIPLNDEANLLLRFPTPSHTVRHFSASAVLDGSVPPSLFNGRIIIIGSSARGIAGSAETPLDHTFPMVETAANSVENLVAGDYFYEPRWAFRFELVSLWLAAFVTTLALFRFPPLVALCTTFSLVGAIGVISQTVLLLKGAFISPQPAVSACTASVGIYAIRIVLLEGRATRRSQAELAIANQFITSALGAMTAVRDVETGQHVVRIQGYMRSLCQAVASNPRFSEYLTPQMIDLLVQLAPIHDIGKVGVPDYILRKPTRLTLEEFTQMKSHVTLGKKILAQARQDSGLRNEVFFKTATDIVYSHHERWDGSGYPQGLRGDTIPIPARLLALADVYDALISKRHYKGEFLHAQAVEEIRREAGTHFDPDIVDAFLQVQDDWRRMAELHRDELDVAASG